MKRSSESRSHSPLEPEFIDRLVNEGFAALDELDAGDAPTRERWQALVIAVCAKPGPTAAATMLGLFRVLQLWEHWLDDLPPFEKLAAHGRVSTLIMLCRHCLSERSPEP